MFPGLDCIFCNVATVVIRGNELTGHSCCRNFVLLSRRNLIIEDLMLQDDDLGLHAGNKLSAGSY